MGFETYFGEHSLSHCSCNGSQDSDNGPNGEDNPPKSTYTCQILVSALPFEEIVWSQNVSLGSKRKGAIGCIGAGSLPNRMSRKLDSGGKQVLRSRGFAKGYGLGAMDRPNLRLLSRKVRLNHCARWLEKQLLLPWRSLTPLG